MIFKICLGSSISRYFRRIKISAQNEPIMSVCNNKACLCTCKNSFVSICELDFDQANTATRPDQGCFRPCRFTRIRLCLQTDSFFFPAWPTVYTKSKNTLLSNVELLKTLAYRFRADGRVKTEVMSLLQRFCVEERKQFEYATCERKFKKKMEKKYPFSKILECVQTGPKCYREPSLAKTQMQQFTLETVWTQAQA